MIRLKYNLLPQPNCVTKEMFAEVVWKFKKHSNTDHFISGTEENIHHKISYVQQGKAMEKLLEHQKGLSRSVQTSWTLQTLPLSQLYTSI